MHSLASLSSKYYILIAVTLSNIFLLFLVLHALDVLSFGRTR